MRVDAKLAKMENFTISRSKTEKGNTHLLLDETGKVIATHNSSTQFGGYGVDKVCLVTVKEAYINGVTPTGKYITEFSWAISVDRLKKSFNYKYGVKQWGWKFTIVT